MRHQNSFTMNTSRGLISSLLAALIVSCGLGCESGSSPPTAASTTTTAPAAPPKVAAGEPKLEAVGGESFNFGAKLVGDEISHVFEVKNVGTTDVTVKTGKPSCTSCTKFEIDKTVLKPNESLKATVHWKLKQETPMYHQFAPLELPGYPPSKALKLYALGRVIKKVMVSPAERWIIGEVKEDEPARYQAVLSSEFLDHFEIKEITCPNPALKITPTPLPEDKLKELKLKSGYYLNAELTSEIKVGDFENRIKIEVLTPEPQTLRVTVVARRNGPVQIFGANWVEELSMINLGAFDPKAEFVGRLNMFVQGIEGDLKIESVDCADSRFSFELKRDLKFVTQPKGRQKYELFVKVAPGKREVVYSTQSPLLVELNTNQPHVGQIKFKVKSSALP